MPKLLLVTVLIAGLSVTAEAAKKPAKGTAKPADKVEAPKVETTAEMSRAIQELNEVLSKAVEGGQDQTFHEDLQLSSNKATMSLDELAKSAEAQPPPMNNIPEAE